MDATVDALPPGMIRIYPGLATEATMQEMAVTDTSATSRTEGLQGKKTRQFGMPNRTIRIPRKQWQYMITNRSKRHPLELLLIK
jgi:hypothetical protein